MKHPGKATRREWIGLAVIALPCLVYAMDLTVLNPAAPPERAGAASALAETSSEFGGGLVVDRAHRAIDSLEP
ncbi:MAG TPA: hypothetical protein VNK91_16635, partial [Burkholderiaceae bacterium]|nr:hypothetical protein [Burkholderiaceae bacterium]